MSHVELDYHCRMPRWCAVKMRVDCPECGSPVLLDGPYKRAACTACGARVSVANVWNWVVERALTDGGRGRHFQLSTLVQAGKNALGNIHVALNKDHPPICASCDAVLDELDQAVADGTNGTFHCPACGAPHPTWPAPGYLKQAGVIQTFLAPPEDAPASAAITPGTTPKPILFLCPNCGASLKIGTETKRISTCEFCDVDTYLPPALWNQLHPVRRRRAFWLRCK